MSEVVPGDKPERTRLSDRVYEQLETMLLDGVIQPGQRIRVDAISRLLGVSQTPVRESLSRLEAEDLVTKTHLIGYSASPKLTPARFEDLFEARFLIEPSCAGLAAGRHQRIQIEPIVELSTQMRQGYEDDLMTYGAFAKKDAELHAAIIDATGNGYFREIFDKLHCHLQLFRLLRDSRVTEDALDEHDEIVTALAERDEERATAAMTAHLTASRARLRSAFHSQAGAREPAVLPSTPTRPIDAMSVNLAGPA
jgi:DNA-binding GntR family transcriptional regulator